MSTERPLLVFDGDCGFCRRFVARWRSRTGGRVDYEPYQQVAPRFPEIPREAFERSVQLIEPDGRVWSGAEAVFRALALAPRGGGPLWAYRRLPGFSRVAEGFYRLVSQRRRTFSTLTRLLWGGHLEPPSYRFAGVLFPRLVGLVYLIAFLSFWVQVEGLIGSRGILPVGRWLDAVHAQMGTQGYWFYPTLCWLSPADAFLHFQCAAGALLALLVIVGAAQAPCLLLCWILYLSLVTAGDLFMGFQWDALLLETGFLAIFAAPMRIVPSFSRAPAPSRTALWLERWLLFRLMFGSGAVKLSSGDSTWRDLTALRYHYETQPLPTWIGWYFHQLPAWFQSASVVVMFVVELVLPWFIFAPRRLRLFSFVGMVSLQLLIGLTGNYTFFNLLAIVLCLLLLDDAAWPRFLREKLSTDPRPTRWPGWLIAPVAAVSVLFGAMLLVSQIHRKMEWPSALQRFYSWMAPCNSLNRYGLFMVMTTSRPEIIVEGSDDGRTWKAYEFQWKPGDPRRPPRFVEPHQPRLDWQMWFAALGRIQGNPWFVQLLRRLAEGSPPVLALLAHNPFPQSPPKYIRAVTYDYHFTDLASRGQDGSWWRRELRGPYSPVFTLPKGDSSPPTGDR